MAQHLSILANLKQNIHCNVGHVDCFEFRHEKFNANKESIRSYKMAIANNIATSLKHNAVAKLHYCLKALFPEILKSISNISENSNKNVKNHEKQQYIVLISQNFYFLQFHLDKNTLSDLWKQAHFELR